MKGFIEVHRPEYTDGDRTYPSRKLAIKVSNIHSFEEIAPGDVSYKDARCYIKFHGSYGYSSESYDEVKAMIEKAEEEERKAPQHVVIEGLVHGKTDYMRVEDVRVESRDSGVAIGAVKDMRIY